MKIERVRTRFAPGTGGMWEHRMMKNPELSKAAKKDITRTADRIADAKQKHADTRFITKLVGTPTQARERRIEAMVQNRDDLIDRLAFYRLISRVRRPVSATSNRQ